MALAGSVLLGFQAAHARDAPRFCPAPGTATRIAPADIGVQSDAGVMAAGSVQRFQIELPAGAHLQLELAIRRENRFDPNPWRVEVTTDGEPAGPLAVQMAWDGQPTRRVSDLRELTDRVRGTSRHRSTLNQTITVELHSGLTELTYSLRASPVFRGDAGTRLDAGGSAETALPIEPGSVIEANSDAIDRDAGFDLSPIVEVGMRFMPDLSPDDDEPVTIDRLRGGEYDPVTERHEPTPGVDPTRDQDQSVPADDGPFVGDGTDLYRLEAVPAGARIAARLLGSEPLSFNHPLPLPSRPPPWSEIEILRPACDAEGRFLLLETEDDPGADRKARAEADSYLAPVAGDYFVRVRSSESTKYFFEVRHEIEGFDLLLDPPRFELLSATLPETPVIAAPVAMGFRLRNLPDFRVTGVSTRFAFVDGGSFEPLEDVESASPLCERTVPGEFRCEIGEIVWGGHADLLFDVDLPPAGLRWLAEWDSADGTSGLPGAHGAVGLAAPPRIRSVISIGDQRRVESRVASHPYPYNARGREGPDFRTLFVTGWNLPQALGDELEFDSDDPSIEYRYIAFPDTDNPLHQETYERGWTRYREIHGLAPDAELPDGLQGLIVRAGLDERIMPGARTLTLNGATGSWALHFGALEADLYFVHADEVIPIANAYLPQSVQIVVEPNIDLPLDEVELVVHEDRLAGRGAATHRISAVRETDRDGRFRYLTAPIVLSGPARFGAPPVLSGQLAIDGNAGAGRLTGLRAEIDPIFQTVHFAMPVLPQMAEIGVIDSPIHEPIALGISRGSAAPTQSLFHLALREAAACKGITVADWSSLDLKDSQADAFWNLVLLTFFDDEIRTEPVRIGHHAAALLLRELFVVHLDDTIRHLRLIEAQDEEVIGLMHRMTDHFGDPAFPINRLQVGLPDGTRTTYGDAVATSDLELLADNYGFRSEEAAREWLVRATREALAALRTRTEELRKEAAGYHPCRDIRELVRLTGRGFGVINNALEPKLRRLELHRQAATGRQWTAWDYDPSALFWMGELEPLMRRVHRQEAVARQDSDLLIALGALIAVPASAATAGSSAAYVAFAFSLADVAATGWLEARDYLARQREIDFSERAAVVLGWERNEAALAEAKAFAELLFNVGISGFFSGLDGVEVIRAIRAAGPVIGGMQVTRSLRQRGISHLTRLERRNFATFAMRSRLRELQLGRSNLSDVEIQALDEVARLRDAAQEAIEGERLAAEAITARPPGYRADVRVGLDDQGRPQVLADPQPEPPAGDGLVPVDRGRVEAIGSGQIAANHAAHVEPPVQAGHRHTAREIAPHICNRTIEFEVDGRTESLSLGGIVGSGATSAAFETSRQVRKQEAVAKLTFETGMYHGVNPDAAGEAAIRDLGSRDLRLPIVEHDFATRAVVGDEFILTRVQIAERIQTAADLLRHRGRLMGGQQHQLFDQMRQLARRGDDWEVEELLAGISGLNENQVAALRTAVEELRGSGQAVTADAVFDRLPGFSDTQLELLDRGIRELNDAGYVFLDFRLDNFGLSDRTGRVQLVVHDAGGIVAVEGLDPVLAREIQLILCEPRQGVLGSKLYRVAEVHEAYNPLRQADGSIVVERYDPPPGVDAEATGEARWRISPFTPGIAQQAPDFAERFAR